MFTNHRSFRAWSIKLNEEINGFKFSHGLSFDKDSLLLHFIRGSNQIAYEVKFVDGELFLLDSHWNDLKSKTKSNAVVQLRDLENQTVERIEYGLFDRLVNIVFSDGHQLILKGYGKFSNVLLYDQFKHIPNQIFRLNYKKDKELHFDDIRTIWIDVKSNEISVPYFDTFESWNQFFKSISSDELIEYHSNFFELNTEGQIEILKKINNPFNFQIEYMETPTPCLNWKFAPSAPFIEFDDHFFDKMNLIFRRYFKWYFIETEKNRLLELSHNHIKKSQIRIKTYQKRIQEIQSQRSFKEIGDLILTNAHSIRKGTSEALITDFYTGHRVRIKINPELNAAENAEKFYKRAKNQHIELKNLNHQLDSSIKDHEFWKNFLNQILEVQESKDIKNIKKQLPADRFNEKKKNESTTSYKKLYVDPFEVWLGKNAKSNEAILTEAHKNDLWLHAADIPGSHVLIRSQGRNIPKNILEIVASLAAYHSKGRGQTIQTVIYTERKWVSKSKGSAPGEVKLSKFNTIDVEPGIFL